LGLSGLTLLIALLAYEYSNVAIARLFLSIAITSALVGWLSMVRWITLDGRYGNANSVVWKIFAIIVNPVPVLLYLLRRPSKPFSDPVLEIMNVTDTLRTFTARISSFLESSRFQQPSEQTRHTAKHMAIALGAYVLFGRIVDGIFTYGPVSGLIRFVLVLAVPAYWVVLPWWVYLDAKWRRMDAMPWAIVTLFTNVFGLATYLVIRYPEPRPCPQCGAYLTSDLKRCPYCGSETEVTCPKCQSPVQPDWLYCPACASQLPQSPVLDTATSPLMSIKGTVTNSVTGSPIPAALVRIDSKSTIKSVTTDELGRFMLTDLPPRPYVLIASADGYATDSKPHSPSATGNTQLHFCLYPIS
jgi:hypothetical protein